MLDLSFNVIEEIGENSFQGLSNLEVLHINDNRLRKLPKKEPFQGLKRLRELDLSSNPLLFLSFNTFLNFLKLEILNLSSTNISVMHNGTFSSFKSLKRLYLNDNPFLCDCNLKWMSEWIQKHVNYNSNVILEMKTSTRCAFPNELAGKRLDTLTPDSFSCSCDTCRKSASCSSKDGADICKCSSSWMGDSCNLVCNATQKHEKTCSSLNGTCYCSYFLPQQTNYSVMSCSQNAVLLNVSNVLRCKCSDGFTGNGTFCTNNTKEQNGEGSRKTNSTSNFAITLSLAISGSVIAVAILSLVAWYICRHRKSSNKRSSEVVPQGVLLDVLPGRQENNVHLNHGLNDAPIQDKWEVSRHCLVVGEVIGEGEFGVVREGTLMKERTTLQVAVKSLREQSNHTDTKDFLRELDMFKGIGKHPNIVSLIGACTSDRPLLIITEYVSGGTLLDLLRNSRRSNTVYENIEVVPALEQHVRLKLALDVVKGMVHISKHQFVHRDLAARNVLVTDDMTAKITDFGLARDIYSDGIYFNSKGGRLPLKWMSPESLQDYIYTTQSDVWSFGILIWEIWSLGAMPYSTIHPHELLSKLSSGYRLEKPPDCPDEVYDIMLSCWNKEPMLRPTFCRLCMIFEEI